METRHVHCSQIIIAKLGLAHSLAHLATRTAHCADNNVSGRPEVCPNSSLTAVTSPALLGVGNFISDHDQTTDRYLHIHLEFSRFLVFSSIRRLGCLSTATISLIGILSEAQRENVILSTLICDLI